MILSNRMQNFSESVFTSLLAIKSKRLSRGEPVYDFSVGTPNVPPAKHIVDALALGAADPKNYTYAISDLSDLRCACRDWYRNRFNVTLDPDSEITSLIGSQEGLSHIALALINEGDTVLVPDPCYPAFKDGPLIAGAELHYMQMRRENNFIIDLRDIPPDVAKRAKLMIVSYPNNPTTAMATDEFYMDLIAFAKDFDITVLHDNAYSDLVFDGRDCGSFLRFDGAMDVGVEFNSLSKTYGLAGARIGFCMGNREVVSALKTLKSNMDYGIFIPVQRAAIAAITGDQACVRDTCLAYQERRDAICDGLRSIGWNVGKGPATMFVWAGIPDNFASSQEFVTELVNRSGVLVTPGSAFGPSGEGFVRLAFVQSVETINEAVTAIKNSGIFK